MIIYFTTIHGLDSSAPWEYDEKSNRAFCSDPIFNKSKEFIRPKGITIDENRSLVILDVQKFSQKHPYTPKKPQKIADYRLFQVGPANVNTNNSILNNCSLFPLKSPRLQSPRDKSPKHSKPICLIENALSADDYPASLKLEDLINENFNQKLAGSTIAYRSLVNKRNLNIERKANFIKNIKSFTHPAHILFQLYELKVKMLDEIELVLELFNKSYIYFCNFIKCSHETRKEITDYFCHAIEQTMLSAEFGRKTNESDSASKNSANLAFFNKQLLQIKLQTLTLNWLVLIDKNLNLELSTAVNLSKETQKTLKKFKSYLLEDTSTFAKIKDTIETITTTLYSLITVEEEHDFKVKNYIQANKEIAEKIDDYYSLKALLINLLKPTIKPMPYESHSSILQGLCSEIIRNIITLLGKDSRFNDIQNGSYVADINAYDTNDLYIKSDRLSKLKDCLTELSLEKSFPKKESLQSESSLSKTCSLVANKVADCLKTLLDLILSTTESSSSYSLKNTF